MALCVEQGPAHQPGCGEVLQAAQLHGQQARHLTLHTGLLHIPVLSQVRMYPGPACTPLFCVLFLEPATRVTTPQTDICTQVNGLYSPERILPWGCWDVQCWPPNFCESQKR